MNMKKVAIVTGASSGIGQQTALDLVKNGYTVIGGARHIANLKGTAIEAKYLDVTDHDSRVAFIQDVITRYGRIDVLVNAAGYGLFGAIEEVPLAEAREQLDVNLLGIADLIKLVIPTMRAQKAGKIVNISSLAGRSYSALAGWYYISKHALETMSDVLRLEMKPFGIDVIIIEPGITRTNWAKVTNTHLLQSTPAKFAIPSDGGKTVTNDYQTHPNGCGCLPYNSAGNHCPPTEVPLSRQV
ncbi:hypothetical protein L248_0459 [Schleiferilactobacillus shenzhenensis LY-73]|uniref:Uncharacterized protein n=2 Tax=Schleiferilactobacillus shenzhenensis TaxID=1231337 RepID=U4TN67_9LACO|nr:hypothetical protein L248_0459 [Schleiferilactobacillus shenzhenensis LY-73]